MTRLIPSPQPTTNDALSTNAIINAHVPAIAITRFANGRAELPRRCTKTPLFCPANADRKSIRLTNPLIHGFLSVSVRCSLVMVFRFCGVGFESVSSFCALNLCLLWYVIFFDLYKGGSEFKSVTLWVFLLTRFHIYMLTSI